jgi:hypothetical protein
MTRLLPVIRLLRRRPYGPLILWIVVAGMLGAALIVARLVLVAPAQDRFTQAEAAWMAARQRVAQRLEAKQARKNLTMILNALPGQRDFAQLPLVMSQVAKRDRVDMPNLSYTQDKPQAGGFTKAVLRGSVSGRYEDLRSFIHHLETAEGFLFIEDLNVTRHVSKRGEEVAFQITLSTYIREGPTQPVSARALMP